MKINMKTLKTLLFSLLLSVALFSCSSTNNTSNTTKSATGREYMAYTNLADILRQQVGVTVKGSGAMAEVSIRGMNSIMLDNRPLYVYDGIELGRDYTRANAAVDRATIKSIRVIRDLNQLTFYGERGRNGVIYIRSRR